MTQEVVSKNEAVARRRISGFVLVRVVLKYHFLHEIPLCMHIYSLASQLAVFLERFM